MSAPFTIDPATGRVVFPDLRFELRPRMPHEEFVGATAGVNRDNLGANGGWQRYSVREQISNDRRLGLFVIFLDGRLVKASFAYGPKEDTWDNWSQEKEAARQAEYQQALSEQLGGQTTFPWGRASVIEDSKSGGTEIWLDYTEDLVIG